MTRQTSTIADIKAMLAEQKHWIANISEELQRKPEFTPARVTRLFRIVSRNTEILVEIVQILEALQPQSDRSKSANRPVDVGAKK